jgi:hypothetical protein
MVRLLSGQAGLHLVRVPVDQLFCRSGTHSRSKYGEPDHLANADYQNGFGAHWHGEVTTWSKPGISIAVSEGAGNGPGQVSDVEVGSARIAATDLKRAERQQEQNF